MSNKSTYTDPAIVLRYSEARNLYAPEQKILDLLDDRLSAMVMLDIGVGGGRTTVHFAPRVRDYVGIDYAAPMVEACKRAFASRPEWTFRECDARDLSIFPDASFDLVCFSFNGIDYVSHEDRLATFRELSRVCRPRGCLFFSSHNLQNAKVIWSRHWSGKWRRMPKELATYLLKCVVNAHYLFGGTREHARLNDGGFRFGLRTYYISPSEQLRQLEAAGFTDIRVFSFLTGEMVDTEMLKVTRDPAPYYLCVRGGFAR